MGIEFITPKGPHDFSAELFNTLGNSAAYGAAAIVVSTTTYVALTTLGLWRIVAAAAAAIPLCMLGTCSVLGLGLATHITFQRSRF